MGHPWPMNILTKEAGQSRKLIVKPVDICPRSNFRPNADGHLRVVDVDKIKLHNTTVAIEVKEQGHFHYYCRTLLGEYRMFGRRTNVDGEYTDIMFKLCKMKRPGLPKGTVVAIEVIWPGHPDSEVPTAIKECPQELKMVALGVPIQAGIKYFDCDEDYKSAQRRMNGILPPEFHPKRLGFKKLGDKFETAEILEYYLKFAKNAGIEGVVFKEFGYDGWWKLKGVKEADVFITGFKISDSETQYGMVTAVNIGVVESIVYDEITIRNMGSITGFDLEEKDKMTGAYNIYGKSEENPYWMKPLRVLYQEIAGKGKLKHGFFDCWRDDKIWDQCTMEQFK